MRSTISAAVLLTLTSSLWAGDWPQFLGPTRNAVSTETGLAKSWPEKGPPVVWERDVGEGFSARSSPAARWSSSIASATKRSSRGSTPQPASRAGSSLTRRSTRTTTARATGPRSTPVVAGGKVYTLGAEGMLHCLDLKEGKKVWEKSLAKEYDLPESFFGIATIAAGGRRAAAGQRRRQGGRHRRLRQGQRQGGLEGDGRRGQLLLAGGSHDRRCATRHLLHAHRPGRPRSEERQGALLASAGARATRPRSTPPRHW